MVDERTSVIIISDELYRLPEKIFALAVFKQYALNKNTMVHSVSVGNPTRLSSDEIRCYYFAVEAHSSTSQ
ncbi:MAG: hypothetical protein DME46_04900 [Verrucomicrobia bacterium]|nr:MAG: hypothetical protein DME46_04900 [Verrucomicrobiota bacterium]